MSFAIQRRCAEVSTPLHTFLTALVMLMQADIALLVGLPAMKVALQSTQVHLFAAEQKARRCEGWGLLTNLVLTTLLVRRGGRSLRSVSTKSARALPANSASCLISEKRIAAGAKLVISSWRSIAAAARLSASRFARMRIKCASSTASSSLRCDLIFTTSNEGRSVAASFKPNA